MRLDGERRNSYKGRGKMENWQKIFQDLIGKVCVITGGGGLIGKAIAIEMARVGAKVAIVDYKKDRCDACADEMSRNVGKQVTCVVADVLNEDMLKKGKQHINQELGKIDILINCAGGNAPEATTELEFLNEQNIDNLRKSFFGINIEGFRSVMDLNMIGSVLPTLVFAEDMIGQGGVVLNISSMSAERPLTKVPAYSAAKASVNNFTQWLAVHLAKVNVRVNALAPGFFLTSQNQYLLLDDKTKEYTARARKIISHTPMGRFGELDELLGTVVYLVSDMSKFVTGAVLPVDGGFGIYSGV
jgi:NAD(P)-dependent dehydrogenase (short-subunit alcohol dehydrogenase family)